eukprot:TRINITY_DN1634_c0_g1_i1.p1 TRINITY_DN1634_c0_g1~~TRINITY_DN1634_c0_g1_i1.p1  ORF type:complete len:686 (-),score=117.05 TRINITY_DN1634_c0_g1_i1:102-2159(-)
MAVRTGLVCALLAGSALLQLHAQPPPPPPGQRAKDLLRKMTLEDKIHMVHGTFGPYAGNVEGNKILGIPQLHLQDGPQGVADLATNVTAWPSALTVAATWDRELIEQWGAAMAEEQRIKGSNVMLGPGVNIARVPWCGRTFEYLGEDPFLAAELAFHIVAGIQSRNVIACVKHWVNNNQEYHRSTVSEVVGERAAYELYYPPFEGAIRAGVGSLMCSYNRINGTYACENRETLTTALKQRLGFNGWVMSDWLATHSTLASADAGLDMEMPAGVYFGPALHEAVRRGDVLPERVDDMVTRILTSMFAIGLFDTPQPTGNLSADATSPQHTALARQLGASASVLVRNSGKVLPLKGKGTKAIAVSGNQFVVTGQGSGGVKTPYVVSPTDGLRNHPVAVQNTINVTYAATQEDAVAQAKLADYAVVVVAVTSTEGEDRTTLSLGEDQDNLVRAVAAVQPNTIVVVRCPGPVLMPWRDQAAAILVQFLPGQEAGNALADVLFGEINPSARLPLSFPTSMQDTWLTTVEQYPGVADPATRDIQAFYTENLLVGYRWYDAKQSSPLFPFGHGLSYTTFAYSGLNVSGDLAAGNLVVTVLITNTGQVSGAEVAQLYLGFPEIAEEPPKQLKGFQKIALEAGHSGNVKFPLRTRDFSVWDVSTHSWALVQGNFVARVGASSQDLRVSATISIA